MIANKMMNKTHIEIVTLVLGAELPTSTKNEIVRHYFLPRLGATMAPVEIEEDNEIGGVDRPTAEEIEIENDPKMKAEFEDTSRLMEKAK